MNYFNYLHTTIVLINQYSKGYCRSHTGDKRKLAAIAWDNKKAKTYRLHHPRGNVASRLKLLEGNKLIRESMQAIADLSALKEIK